MKPYATIAGIDAQPLRIRVPSFGPWYASAELLENTDMSGRVEVRIGSMTLFGTVQQHGVWSMRSSVRIVAGAGGWAKTVEPKHYHSDAGVKTRMVVQDIARQIGETLGTVQPARERVGIAFTRCRGPASRALHHAIDPTPWWVDYAGVTHISPRETTELVGSYDVLHADSQAREVVLSSDELGIFQIGSILRRCLAHPLVVQFLQHTVIGSEVRTRAWGIPL